MDTGKSIGGTIVYVLITLAIVISPFITKRKLAEYEQGQPVNVLKFALASAIASSGMVFSWAWSVVDNYDARVIYSNFDDAYRALSEGAANCAPFIFPLALVALYFSVKFLRRTLDLLAQRNLADTQQARSEAEAELAKARTASEEARKKLEEAAQAERLARDHAETARCHSEQADGLRSAAKGEIETERARVNQEAARRIEEADEAAKAQIASIRSEADTRIRETEERVAAKIAEIEAVYWNSPEGRKVRAEKELAEIQVQKAADLARLRIAEQEKAAEISQRVADTERQRRKDEIDDVKSVIG